MPEHPFGPDFDKVFHQFLARPESPPSEALRIASLYHGGRVSEAVEELGFSFVWKHSPRNTRLPNFDRIPPVDFLVASLPENRKAGVDVVLRYLRVRRPWVFLITHRGEDSGLFYVMQEKTDRLGYTINRTVQGGTSFLVGTLGEDLPDLFSMDSLAGRIIKKCVEQG